MFKKSSTLWYVIILGVFVSGNQHAQAQQETPMGSYTFFKPTPREYMRDMSTDRPDLTESPITVDAGHIQIEADAVFYSQNKSGGVTDKGLSIAAINFKVGMTNNIDLQFVLPSFNSVKTEAGTSETTEDGWSDLTTRLKINLIGNDEGDFALGIMPIAKLPTASEGFGNDEFEFGVIVPTSFGLPNGFGAGAMVELDFLMDTKKNERFTSLVLTGTVGRDLSGQFGAFIEIYGEKSFVDESEWQSLFSTGLNYVFSKNLKFDTGVFVGLTDGVEDLQVFLGMSFRR
jgi:hypothetical protein